MARRQIKEKLTKDQRSCTDQYAIKRSLLNEEDEEKIMYPQLRCGHLFTEKRNTCLNRNKKIHNILLRVGEFKIKKRKI